MIRQIGMFDIEDGSTKIEMAGRRHIIRLSTLKCCLDCFSWVSQLGLQLGRVNQFQTQVFK